MFGMARQKEGAMTKDLLVYVRTEVFARRGQETRQGLKML